MKPTFPKISIITVSFNQGRFIEDNILSVINQDYPNVEHIIIDAGSTDETLNILKKYDKYLIWISEPDKGQSDGLNKGFKRASGEIIGWINSDDRLAPRALLTIANYFFSNPSEIAVVGDINLISESGEFIRKEFGGKYIYNKMLCEKRGVTQPSTFFKRLVFDNIGYLDVSLEFIMDFEFFMRLASLQTVPYINKTLAEFRLHNDSKTTYNLSRFRKEHLKVAYKYGAPLWSKGIRSDIYVILSNPLRRIRMIRNIIRKFKGLEPYSLEKFR